MLRWTEESVIALIEFYKEKHCLWDPECDQKNITGVRTAAWTWIVRKLIKMYKQKVTAMECKQKLKYLLQKLRKERMKIRNAPGEGAKSDWPFYYPLSFLENTAYPLIARTGLTTTCSRRKPKRIKGFTRSVINEASVDANENSIPATPIIATKKVAKRSRKSYVTPAERRTLRCRKSMEQNTTDNGTQNVATPVESTETPAIKQTAKRPKIVNVNIIHKPTPKIHRNQTIPASTALNLCETPAQDECQSFGTFVINKMRNYSSCARSAVEHAISDILFNADMGYYDRLNSSSAVTTQTETIQEIVEECPETIELCHAVKTEEIIDLDDDCIQA